MRPIKRIIIHCSATPPHLDIGAGDIRRWHTAPQPRGNGWKDIGYHYVIRLDGTLETGRPIEQAGAHTVGQNRDTVGVCYVGGVDQAGKAKDTLLSAQLRTLEELVHDLRERFGPLPIFGHNDFANKACPSFKVAVRLKHLLT